MEALVGRGKRFHLSSRIGVNSFVKPGRKTVVLVKLTDAAIKAIEECRTGKGKPNGKLTIQCLDNQGLIIIPGADKQCHEFQFTTSDLKSESGSFKCIEEVISRADDTLAVVDEFTKKLCVMATDEVYRSTKEKMAQADEEIRKSWAKEIDVNDPSKGRRIKKPIRPSSLPATGNKKSPNVGSRLVTVDDESSAANGRLTPSSALATAHAQGTSRSAIPSPVAGKTANTTVPPSLPNGSAGSAIGSLNSAFKPVVSDKDSKNFSLRSRIIHLLALRPYKKLELFTILQRDGISEKGKNSLSKILNEVAVFKSNQYFLLKKVYSEIQVDWPLYTPENKNFVIRLISEPGAVLNSPAVSPCLSTSSSRSSPAPVLPQKRPLIVNNDDIKYQVPTKKRIAHNSKALTTSSASDGNSYMDQRRNVLGAKQKTREKLDCNVGVDDKQNVYDDYRRQYVEIETVEQRQLYKNDFNADYDEYRELYAEMAQRVQIFQQLHERMTNAGSNMRETIQEQIVAEYQQLHTDNSYIERRKRCDFLHAKLGHIKSLVDKFDSSRYLSQPVSMSSG